jgi:hypothetical protein
VSIDRIETGRVFGNKTKVHEYVRITEVSAVTGLPISEKGIPAVHFEIWDTHEHEEPWSRKTIMPRTAFEERYRYLPEHLLNQQIEHAEAEQMLNAATRQVVRSMVGTDVTEAIRLVDSLVNMARREAALRIAVHEWDEGCAAGCCDDSRGAEKASDLIMVTFTEAERAELLGEGA